MSRIINAGEWIYNERTGKNCKVIINADLEYDFCPLVTTRKSYWKSAVAEFVGYMRGYSSAEDFRKVGTKTWDANANENSAWLKSPHRKGEDDMGLAYRFRDLSLTPSIDGVISAKNTRNVDQLKEIYDNLKNGVDNRRLIMTAYIPHTFDFACLPPCVHTHTFSLVNGTLHLTSTQRSCDVPLGLNFNMVQLHFFLKLMAQITGHKAGKVYHKIVNAHIYEDQYELAKMEAKRPVLPSPTMNISEDIKTLEDVETMFDVNKHVTVENYVHHPEIKYPFSV